jgi:hypothetical protein
MGEVLGLWLDGYTDVDRFYRGQEAVMLATVAAYERAGVPMEDVFARFSEVSHAIMHACAAAVLGFDSYFHRNA